MKEHQHHLFLEALVLAVVLFGLGIMLGFFIESNRTENIANQYLHSEINMLDAQIQTELIKQNGSNCDLVISKNIEFGNKIYEDAKLLEKYEASAKLSQGLRDQQKRYSVLRTLFWMNSIEIKNKCQDSFHTVVYLYDYQTNDLVLESKQEFYSKYLLELKAKYGNKIMLIPIARNLDLSSVDILVSKYNLTTTSIIMDEKLVVDSIDGLEKIEDKLSMDVY